MKVALIGASGAVGSCILEELLNRGHSVTGICRRPEGLPTHQNLTAVARDAGDPDAIAPVLAGHDAVIVAIRFLGFDFGTLLAGIRQSGVKRVIMVGHAGTLLGPGDKQLADTDAISPFFKPEALDAREAFKLLRRANDLDWTCVTPAALLTPGKRLGEFRLGGDQVLRDRLGESRISTEDFAIVVVDELEHSQYIRQRFTAAY